MDWNQVLNNVINIVINWATTAGLRLVIALVLLFVSFKVVNFIARKTGPEAISEPVCITELS